MIAFLDLEPMQEPYRDLAARALAARKGRVPGRTRCPLRHRPRVIARLGCTRAGRSQTCQARYPRFRARDQP